MAFLGGKAIFFCPYFTKAPEKTPLPPNQSEKLENPKYSFT